MTESRRALLVTLIAVVVLAVAVIGGLEFRNTYRDRASRVNDMHTQAAALEDIASGIPGLRVRRDQLVQIAQSEEDTAVVPDLLDAGRILRGLGSETGLSMLRLSPTQAGLSVIYTGSIGSLLVALNELRVNHRQLSVASMSLDSHRVPGAAEMTIVVRYADSEG